jgi:DNA-binding transcriptional ArsR family regulator
MPSPDAIVLPEVTTVAIRLDPVQTIINSMVLLVRSEELSGLNTWIYETAAAMTPEQKKEHDLVLIGFHYTVLPTRLWKDFPSYLNHLENRDPIALRDQMLDFYLECNFCKDDTQIPDATRESLMEDVDFFLDYLRAKFGEENVVPEIETKAFELINAPEKMQKRIVSHLSFMWEKFYKAEWDRVKPMLEDAVMAFEEIDLSTMSRDEAAKYVTGREVDQEFWSKINQDAQHLVFVPSAHNGPYLGQFQYKNAQGVIFGARLPKDTEVHAPDLSRNEITVRLSALADDVRLHILKLIAEEGELRSQEIMERLDLSQSAASRHLKQLSATGYLVERRCSGAKCYTLNEERIQDTLRAVGAFLLCE